MLFICTHVIFYGEYHVCLIVKYSFISKQWEYYKQDAHIDENSLKDLLSNGVLIGTENSIIGSQKSKIFQKHWPHKYWR